MATSYHRHHESIADAIADEQRRKTRNEVYEPITFDLEFYPNATSQQRQMGSEAVTALCDHLKTHPCDRQGATFVQSEWKGIPNISLDLLSDDETSGGRFLKQILDMVQVECDTGPAYIQRASCCQKSERSCPRD